MAGKPKEQLSYRWRTDGVTIDVVVPERANDQAAPPLTVNRLHAPQMPGLQQAIMRTERITVSALDVVGWLRRPNLLGAVVLKSEAAVTDNRDRDRHRSDLVALGSAATIEARSMSN